MPNVMVSMQFIPGNKVSSISYLDF